MTRRITISSSAFEDLIRRLPAYVDIQVTADPVGTPNAKKYADVDGVVYIAPNEVAS